MWRQLLVLNFGDGPAGPKRPKLALLSAMRQKSAAATKQALSSLHDAGAPEVPDLDPCPAAAPSTLASEMPMATLEEGACLCIACLPCSLADGACDSPRRRHMSLPALPSSVFTAGEGLHLHVTCSFHYCSPC